MGRTKKNQPELTAKDAAEKNPKADKPKEEKKVDLIQPLKVEITFAGITGLKLPIALDDKGHLTVGVQFQARVDPFEIFRLANLINQPNGGLSVTFTSPQTAMDFRFDRKEGKVEVLKAETPLPPAKTDKAKDKAGTKALATTGDPITFQEITFNHIPTEERPFGVVIDFVSNGTGEALTVAGRGKSATDAVIAGVKATKGGFEALEQPFEIVAAVKKTKETPAQIKIIRAIEVGTFPTDGGKGDDKKTKGA